MARSLDVMGMMAPGVLPPVLYADRGTGDVLAARFIGDRPHIEVLDPRFAELHAELASKESALLHRDVQPAPTPRLASRTYTATSTPTARRTASA